MHRVDLSVPEGDTLSGASLLTRAYYALSVQKRLHASLETLPDGCPVLWPSVSPSPLGHARDLTGVLPALSARRPVYAVVHRGDFHALFEHSLTRHTAQRVVRRVTKIVFNTETLAQRCAEWVPAEKRAIIPNTIDLVVSPEAAARKAERRLAGRPVRVLYLSGMIPSKGYLVALGAVAELVRRGVPVQATFAGRWPSAAAEREFGARARASGAAQSVRHLGSVSDRNAVRELYLDADLFVLPTSYPVEAQPLTIIEALSAGTPVISTAHASIPDMIENGTSGVLAPPEAHAFADAIERCADPERWRALSLAARARFDAAFSPGAVRKAWMTLLSSA